MKYLQRLVRRLTGLAPENSLRPGERRWQDTFDPFETWAIAPATIPLTSKRKDADPQIPPVVNDDSLPEWKRKDIVKVDKPANKMEAETDPRRESTQITAKRDSGRLKNGKTTGDMNSGRLNHLKARKKTALPDVTVDADTGFVGIKSKHLRPAQDRDASGRRPDDSNAEVIPGRSKLFGRLRQKATSGGQTAIFLPSISKSRQKPHSAIVASVSAETASAAMWPAILKTPSIPATRRRKPAASRAEPPRLVIGNLKVDVIAVDHKPNPRHSGAPAAGKTKSIRRRDIGRRAVKMKFGLGQM